MLSASGLEKRMASYNEVSQNLIKLKTLNRFYYSKLNKQRENVEKCKESVDKRRLHLENLLYEVDHWNREIDIAKEINTPQLTKLETDLSTCSGDGGGSCDNSARLCQYGSAESLDAQHAEYIAVIQKEKEHREELKEVLHKKQLQQYKLSEKLNKKRKFLDELPTRASSINSIARTLQPQFDLILKNSSATPAATSVVST